MNSLGGWGEHRSSRQITSKSLNPYFSSTSALKRRGWWRGRGGIAVPEISKMKFQAVRDLHQAIF